MSGTEHNRGVLTPTNKTWREYDSTLDDLEAFKDEYYKAAIVHNEMVYEVTKENIDPYDDIMFAEERSDKTISFELRYHNGGCGFDEALEEALKSLDKKS